MLSLDKYKTLVFDCDGVILDSNVVKTQAFYLAALPYGEAIAKRLVDFHTLNGGVSRYKKFDHFFSKILARPPAAGEMNAVLRRYAEEVKQGLLDCSIAPGLQALRDATPSCRWLIASGGDQQELRETFAARGISALFDGGIFGSPDTKNAILNREIASGNLQFPSLFLGDSRFDYECAVSSQLDFVFVYAWTEFCDWKSYFKDRGVECFESVSDLLPKEFCSNQGFSGQ